MPVHFQQGTLGNYLAPEEKNTTQASTAPPAGHVVLGQGTGSWSVLSRMQVPKASLPSAFRGHPRRSKVSQHPQHPGRALQSEAALSPFPRCRRHLPCPPPRNVTGMPSGSPAPQPPVRAGATRPFPGRGTYRRRREQPPSADRGTGRPGTLSAPSLLLSPRALPRQKSFGAKTKLKKKKKFGV